MVILYSHKKQNMLFLYQNDNLMGFAQPTMYAHTYTHATSNDMQTKAKPPTHTKV